jgi:glycosyltransferase involved in cell wall biosynthesis
MSLSIIYYILLIILILVFIIQLGFYLIPYTAILRRIRNIKKGNVAHTVEQPPVSIIICARNEGNNLQRFLPLVLEQNYINYEVIVVNDGSCDDTENVIKDLQKVYNNLYITNIPQETRIISHKKLAITVGVKAAKNEILLFTDADCRPLTPDWITTMVRNFDENTEFVLGHGNYYRESSFISKMISYDTLTIAMQYMGFALLGYPYMGVGRNMAYRRSTFFRLKGFAGFLHIPSGDDDLLINAFGKKHNTRIEPSLEAETLSLPKTTFKDWYYQKLRHLGTVDVYKSDSKMWIGLEPFTRGLFYLVVLLLVILGYNNTMILASALSSFLLRFFIQFTIINLTAKAYKDKGFGLSIILFDIILPLVTLYILTIGKIFRRKTKFIWK